MQCYRGGCRWQTAQTRAREMEKSREGEDREMADNEEGRKSWAREKRVCMLGLKASTHLERKSRQGWTEMAENSTKSSERERDKETTLIGIST